MKSKLLSLALLAVAAGLFASCGEGKVNITDASFEPKIVIQGTLIPGQPAAVRIMRNFPLNVRIAPDDIIVTDANAEIVDAQDNAAHRLTYNPETGFYDAGDLQVRSGRSYILEVQTTIDGRVLSARSETTVPQAGFSVLEERSVLGSRQFRQRDASGELVDFSVTFERSPGTSFYAVSVSALDADTSTFIYDNPFGDFDVDDVLNDFADYAYTFTWIQDTPLTPGQSSMDIFSFLTWFYGDYQAIVYAADNNFKDFLTTHDTVQEIDGNFHEPAFHIDGDGIGVFGSALADTVSFFVLRP